VMLSGKGSRRASNRTRTGIAGFLVGGGVLAGLQLLQQVVGVFNPREIVTVLIAVAVALATTAAARWLARTQRDTKLKQELRSWPLPLLKDADPLLLGIWPESELAHSTHRGLRNYAELDARLRVALSRSWFVLLYGPPRSGKSRTAATAAQNALSEAPVIIPRGPEAFEALLDPDLKLETQGTEVVLWLDGLERYADAIDPNRLEELARIGGGAKIVATIRTDEWAGLHDTAGQRGEAAKAIVARARVFGITEDGDVVDGAEPVLGRDTPERVATEHPGWVDHWLTRSAAGTVAGLQTFVHWLARSAARTAAGLQTFVRSLVPSVSKAGVGQRSGWNDRGLVLPAVGSLAVILALALLATLGEFKKSVPPPISDQVREIRVDATQGDPDTEQDDRHARTYQVDLQGGGENSYVFVFEDGPDRDGFFRLLGGDDPDRPTSDELRVYDVEDGRLEERFRFQPDDTGRAAALFERRGIGDVDDDQAQELIGGYGRYSDGSSEAQLPFALEWDDADERYRMVSLQLEPPALPRPPRDPRLEPLFAAYSEPITLRDRDSGHELSGYRAQDFAVDSEPVFRLLAGYLIAYPNERHDGIMRLEPYQFRTGAPRLNPCQISERQVLAVIPNGGSRENALLDRWAEVSAERRCVPQP
jgi:hypothetical protein